jgi:hypothetical protein
VTVQCEFCGRVRGADGQWTRDDTAEPGAVGYCHDCGEARKRAAEERYWRAARKARHARARKVTDEPDWDGLKRGL